MQAFELFMIGVGLSMDAFAVSVSKGLYVRKYQPAQSLCCGVWFGGFQMLMPLAGYLLGVNFAAYVHAVAHWIAFVLLALIGIWCARLFLVMMSPLAHPLPPLRCCPLPLQLQSMHSRLA